MFVLAGFFNRAEVWLDFADEWNACLMEAPAISNVHMLEAATLNGQFTNWKGTVRDAKLRSLAEVIKRYGNGEDFRAIYFTTSFDLFKKYIVTLPMEKPISAVYLWGLFLIIFSIQKELETRGITEGFESTSKAEQSAFSQSKSTLTQLADRDFGLVKIGASATKRETLTNMVTIRLNISSIALTGTTLGTSLRRIAPPNFLRATKRVRCGASLRGPVPLSVPDHASSPTAP